MDLINALRIFTLVGIGVGIFLFIGEVSWAVQHGYYRLFALRDILEMASLGSLAVRAIGSGASNMTYVLSAAQDAPMWIYLVLSYGFGFGASNIIGRSEEWLLRWQLARLSRSA